MLETIDFYLDDGAFMPERAHNWDAGIDLMSPNDVLLPKCSSNVLGRVQCGEVVIDTGVHIQIPKGYVGFLKSKSGLNVKHGITSEGVIDSGYTGSIIVKLYNHSGTDYVIRRGDKVTQLVILPIETPELHWVDEFEKTERGDKGFGSTGR